MTVAARPRNPIIPGDTGDRTGTAGIRRRAGAAIRRRFAGLLRDVLAIFDGIRIYSPNDAQRQAPRTIYALTADEMATLTRELHEALSRWIARDQQQASAHWWAGFDAEAAQLGSAQAAANLAGLAPAYAATRSLQQIVFSTPYRNRLAMAQIKSYEHWTGLAGSMRSELSQIIGRAVVDGKNPRAVRKEIAERLDVSKARALQYGQTDITDTLRQARQAEADHAEETLGLRLGMLWTSALKATTRASHAVRHGRVYSTAEVRAFYEQRANRYNCYCSTTECLVDDDGRPILTDTLKSAMAKEKATWDRRAAP